MSEQRMFHPVCSLIQDETEKLEQSSSFGPFPREFILFTFIAGRTCKNNIINAISRDVSASNSAQREGMFNVINVLSLLMLKFSLTIVAFVALTFQLLLDLFKCVSSLNRFFTSVTKTTVNSCLFFYFWSCFIGLALRLYLFLNFWTASVRFSLSLLFFSYLWTISIGPCPFFHFRSLLVNFSVISFLFLYFWTIPVSLYAFLYICPTIICFHLDLRAFLYFGAIMIFFAVYPCLLLYFWATSIGFQSIIFTFFTLLMKTIFFTFVVVKVLRSSRENLVAFGALLLRDRLGYNVTHGKGHSFSSRLWDVSASAGATHYLPSYYTIESPQKQVQGVFA